MLTSGKAWKLGYFKTLSGMAGWLKIQPAAYNKTVKSRPPLLHVAPRADAGKIPYYAGKRQFLAIVKWQEAV